MKKLIFRSCLLCTITIVVALVISFTLLYVYPEWFLGKDFFKMVKESVWEIHTNKNMFWSGKHPIPEMGPPFVLENQTRYHGEDAMFTCRMTFNGTISDIIHVPWLKNNEAVVNGANRHITLEVTNHSEGWVNVITNLTIYSVTEDDFGMYQCYVIVLDSVELKNDSKQKHEPKRRKENVDCCCECVNSPSHRKPEFNKEDIALLYYLLHKFHWIGEFHLLREKPRIRTLFIVPGTLVSLAVYYRHLREIDDFSVRFTRSGQDIQSFDIQCSYSVRVREFVLYLNGTPVAHNTITYRNVTDVGHWKTSVGVISSCISPSMYGVYQITILRKVNNKDGTQRTEEINFPTKVYIKPKDSTIVTENLSNNTNRALVVFNESCWSNEELEPESCKYIQTLVESIFDTNILYESSIAKNIVILLLVSLLISVFLLFVCPLLWCKLLQRYCVMQKSGNKSFAGIQVNPNIEYDLYISSVTADRLIIAQNILPILKRLDLIVFCGQDNILPGRSEITEIPNAINKSLKYLVIVSKKYLETALQNDFEINCIIKPCSNRNLMIVNVDNCPIHEMFDKMYTVINCSREGLSEQDKAVLMCWAVINGKLINSVFQILSTFITRCLSFFYQI